MLLQEGLEVVGQQPPAGGEVEGTVQLDEGRAVAALAGELCRVGPEEARGLGEGAPGAAPKRQRASIRLIASARVVASRS